MIRLWAAVRLDNNPEVTRTHAATAAAIAPPGCSTDYCEVGAVGERCGGWGGERPPVVGFAAALLPVRLEAKSGPRLSRL